MRKGRSAASAAERTLVQPQADLGTNRRIRQLELRGITKEFPGVVANDCIDLEICAGEILCLLGENGAGKTTLMRILYGMYQPDAGQILINGEVRKLASPNDAIREGIGMIHQHFMLVSDMSVVENVVLGLPGQNPFLVDLDGATKRIRELSRLYGLKVDPHACIWQLSVGEQQRVEIIKALYREADVLILDEPTAVLTPQEVDDLFVTLRDMAANGHAIVFISHKLKEVMAIADRITVLRQGRVADNLFPEHTNVKRLACSMVGREVLLELNRTPNNPGEERLTLKGVCAQGDDGREALHDIDLAVHSDEIVGVAGVSGNGQRELVEAITGVRPITGGEMKIGGRDVTSWKPAGRMRLGLSVVPEGRLTEATIPDFPVSGNLILKDHTTSTYAKSCFLRVREVRRRSAELCSQFDVRAASIDAELKTLSGGNIQKLILARELSREPRVLVAAQPTRGVDVGAMEFIHNLLLERRAQGMAILLVSEDLDEILSLSDRIVVMYEGEIVGVVPREEATAEMLGLLMAGSSVDSANDSEPHHTTRRP